MLHPVDHQGIGIQEAVQLLPAVRAQDEKAARLLRLGSAQQHQTFLRSGADMGGMGSMVHTEKKDGLLCWIIDRPDGSVNEIKIDPKESNKY